MENVGCTRWGLRRHIRVVIYIYVSLFIRNLEDWCRSQWPLDRVYVTITIVQKSTMQLTWNWSKYVFGHWRSLLLLDFVAIVDKYKQVERQYLQACNYHAGN